MFTLSQNINLNKIFIINRSELEGRWDATIYKPAFSFISNKFETKKLSDVAVINPSVSFDNLDNDTKINFVPMEVIDESNGIISDIRFKNVSESKGFTRFQENDLLWAKITPCMQNGKSAIARNLKNGYGCGSTEFYIIRSKSDKVLLIDYVFILLRDKRILSAAQNYFGGSAGQQRVSVDYLRNFKVPLPSLEIQQKIVNIYQSAYQQKQQKETQAQALLASIDDYLLGELGITMPSESIVCETVDFHGFELNKHNPLVKNGRLFLTRFREIGGGRFDPVNSLYLGKKSKSTIYENIPLCEIAVIEKGQSITSKEIVKGEYPVIAGGQSSPYSHDKYNNEANVITVSSSGAYAGFVWYHDYPVFASDCSVIRAKNENIFSTKYIFEVLKAKQKEIYLLQQGAGQPHVYPADLAKILIPVVPANIQEKLICHINSLRQQALLLQKEAIQTLQQAKEKVEKMILE